MTRQSIRHLNFPLLVPPYFFMRLPVSIIKIDRTFVDGLPGDEGDAAISSAIISIARTMGIDIIAEGVEESEQVNDPVLKDGA